MAKKRVQQAPAMIKIWSATAAALWLLVAPVAAQVQTVDRTASGLPGKDIRVGLYVNVRPDCTSGPLPAIQLTTRPEHGNVTVKKANVRATNYKQCLALEVPGFVAFYRSKPDFVGVDTLVLEVKYPGGRSEIQKITVTVGTGAPGRRT